MAIADRLTVLNAGKVIARGRPADVTAYLGQAA
jgi:ABC-type branched-subunit amino acid transport system ATPase component